MMPKDEENLHANHRQRLKKRFAKDGLASFEDHNILELLLFYAIPRCDTNPIAHRLMNKFGTLHGVFEAPKEQLAEVKGMGPSSAEYINLCGWIAREASLSELEGLSFSRAERIGAYFTWYFRQMPWETSCLLMLDEDKSFIACEIINLGTKYKPASVRDKALELAKERLPAYAVLAHSHPDGRMSPSPEDNFLTECIQEDFQNIGVELIGHYIVYKFDYIEFMKENEAENEGYRRMESERNYGI